MPHALRLINVGGLGLMLNPSAKHLQAGGPAQYLRVFDRGTRDARRDSSRDAWRQHGAELVGNYDDLVGDGQFDGAVICAGKNGDDFQILKNLVPRMAAKCSGPPFILHLSTVSSGFVAAAHAYCRAHGIAYGNYPLTGGPAGAEAATMLILASGERSLYERVQPMLQAIGKPKYFGAGITAGAEVKLIGQYMVFAGLNGITSAAALQLACLGGELGDAAQVEFFDFLNAGAGGTRQWDVALSKGLRDHVWDQGFMLQHAVVDAIYAAQLGLDKGLPSYSLLPMLHTALAFAYLLQKYPGQPLGTHAVVRELVGANATAFDAFLRQHLRYPDMPASIRACIEALPEKIQETVLLEVAAEDFIAPQD